METLFISEREPLHVIYWQVHLGCTIDKGTIAWVRSDLDKLRG